MNFNLASRLNRIRAARLFVKGFALGICTAVGTTCALAAPGETIGSAVTVVNFVTAKLDGDGDRRQLSNGDDVRHQELIEVDANSRSEIELRDRTKLALGPGAKLLLDQFVYDPDISGGAIVMDLIKGTFRFITGIAAKPAYVIRTPAASITVRGTIFDVYVLGDAETWLLLHEGGVEVCIESGKCLLHDQPGKLIRITADRIEKPTRWAKMQKAGVEFDDAFPFVAEPPLIDPDPIFTREDIVSAGVAPPRHPSPPKKYEPEPKPSKPTRAEKPKKSKHVELTRDDEVKVKVRVRKVKKRKHRSDDNYPRRSERRHSRAGKIIKKGAAIGIGIGIGIGVGKLLKKY
jgi:hypothetical protein